MKNLVIIVVIICSGAITALGIDASDTLSGSRSTLLASLFSADKPSCPIGMVELKTTTNLYCVDAYEVSAGDNCPVSEPISKDSTAINISSAKCAPVSVPGKVPWTNVTFFQAEQLCAAAGKTLLTPQVWYEAALGTVDNTGCNISGKLSKTGAFSSCKSGMGAFDMIGNVWELVKVDVKDGKIAKEILPDEGYIDGINSVGIPVKTSSTTPNKSYQNDYFWSGEGDNRVMMRGGFYGGNSDSGLYSTHTGISNDFSSGAIGFRCMIVT